jgi:antitoxin component YwqK of YwqJK toxin-antitoxin module
MRYTYFILILSLLVGCTQINSNYYPTYRDITIKADSSNIYAQVLVKSQKVEPLNNLRYYWYSNEKISSNTGGFAGSLLNGTYRVMSKGNQLVEQGFFVNGVKDGSWKYWYSNGNLKRVEIWKKGILKSSPVEYDIEGNLLSSKATELTVEENITEQDSSAVKKPWYKRIFKKKQALQ